MSQSLKEEFPNVNGFSVTNLKYMKRFFEFYKGDNENRQQVVDDLENICSVSWGHHNFNNDKMRKRRRSIVLSKEVIKDPYNFDFLTLTEGYHEKELEDALTNNITKFLLELGQGFAYIGRQQPI